MILALSFAILAGATAETRLPAGSVITPGQIAGCAEPCALIGRQLSRTIFPGRTVSWADTQAPDAVGRNTRVSLVFRHGALRLEAKGRALDAGPVGGAIDVMNDESRRVVTGTVVAPGVVEVSL